MSVHNSLIILLKFNTLAAQGNRLLTNLSGNEKNFHPAE